METWIITGQLAGMFLGAIGIAFNNSTSMVIAGLVWLISGIALNLSLQLQPGITFICLAILAVGLAARMEREKPQNTPKT